MGNNLLYDWFELSNKKPKWRKEFESKLTELEYKTGLDRNQLLKVADVMEKLDIVRI